MAATLVVLGVLVALGPEVRQPAPDFISDVSPNLQIELELGEEHMGELGVYGESFDGACSALTPSGSAGATQMRGASRYTYGAQEWHLIQVLEIPEAGTYQISCSNAQVDFGIASMDVVESAPTRQMVWALAWVLVPVLGLATTVTLTVLTRVRDRRQKAAAVGHY
ncbi:hypothetical protein BJF83_23210 [Nocardiopsis sp. CNR-923]|nr:hypothetical protein BJF83_23210 [Nocardiopsis sp. CNR-923]